MARKTNLSPERSQSPHRFLKLPEVRALTTLSTSEIYRRIGIGAFPKQILIGPKSAVWIEAEIIEWLEVFVRERRGEKVRA